MEITVDVCTPKYAKSELSRPYRETINMPLNTKEAGYHNTEQTGTHADDVNTLRETHPGGGDNTEWCNTQQRVQNQPQ